jgi:hypothetical protein
MNIFNIIEEIEKVDTNVNEGLSPRRAALKNLTGFGSKVAVAALPFALGAFFNKGYGQNVTPVPTNGAAVNDILNFVLKIKYLEAALYAKGLATTGLIPVGDVAAITTIATQENAHVAFLQSVLGSAAVAQNTQGTAGVYDFTGAFIVGPAKFPTVFTNYDTFLSVANILEDTGIRAIKGQIPNLIGNQSALNNIFKIHSVEGRHAAEIRQIRKARTVASLKPWISANITGSNTDTGIGTAADAFYAGETNGSQLGYTVSGFVNSAITTSTTNISTNAALEAFDEPLTMAVVLPLVAIFGVV